MANLTSTLSDSGWDQKTVALLGLIGLVCLDAPGLLAGPLAAFGTAHTIRTLASRPHDPETMLWLTGICLVFSAAVSWILHCWLPVPQMHLFLGALAFVVVKHKRLPEPSPSEMEEGRHP